MKKTLAVNILEHLAVCCPRLMIGAFFVPYGYGIGQALRRAERIATRCPHDFSNHSRGAVSVTLHRMKNQKLVSVSGPKKKALWSITRKGKNHFESRKKEIKLLPEDGKTRLAIFDIPEGRRKERDWLRGELLACDYTPLQKSVFMGIRPLPRELLEDLESRGLLSCVHIVGLEND